TGLVRVAVADAPAGLPALGGAPGQPPSPRPVALLLRQAARHQSMLPSCCFWEAAQATISRRCD
ncbi:MAG: hypothetical protein PHS32_21125, partial [Rhodoferax sp.]|uniref:hypothetical protein n=1 Tax=Rhodoferax sp. TaxID=50421 RepID=UPI0026213EF3